MSSVWKHPIALVVALGAFVRFFPLSSKCLWLDEAISAYYLRYSFGETLWRSGKPGALHPPLYFLLLQAWSTLWGKSEFALRSLSAAMGTLTILGVYLVVRDCRRLDGTDVQDQESSRSAALLAAFMIAMSPLQVHLSQIVRGYTLATAFLVFATWFMLRALRAESRPVALVSAACLLAVAACYTHYLTILTVLSQLVFAAVYLRYRSSERRNGKTTTSAPPAGGSEPRTNRGWSRFGRPILGILVLLLALVPALTTAYSRAERWRQNSFSRGSLTVGQAANETLLALSSTPDDQWPPPMACAWIAILLLLSACLFLTLRREWSGWLLAAGGLLPPLILIAYSSQSSRNIYRDYYLAFSQIFWISIVVVAASRLPRRTPRSMATLALVWLTLTCYGSSWESIGPVPLDGIGNAVRFVADSRTRDERVLCSSPYLYFNLDYYARDRFRPKLLVNKAMGPWFFGAHYLNNDALIRAEHLEELDSPGFWLVHDGSPYADVPERWELLTSQTFSNKALYLNGYIVVCHYQRRGSAAGPR